jgi:hypothetical protein
MVPVSVVLAVYNGEPYLAEAIESIRAQTFREFELVIVDDASTDHTWQLLERYAARDRRLVLLRNVENAGQTPSLNRGLDAARGRYIARMDADDVALPARLEAQVAFLDAHDDVGLLGTACRLIDAAGHGWGVVPRPEHDLQIRWTMMLENAFSHPTVMLRAAIVNEHGLRYDPAFAVSQDYDLWSRVLRYTRGANLRRPLLKYREHARSLTHAKAEVMRRDFARVALRTIHQELPHFSITPGHVEQLMALTLRQAPRADTEISAAALVGTLLDMLALFGRAHAGAPTLRAVQRHATVQIARLLLGVPLRFEVLLLYRRLLQINPALPWSVVRYLTHVGPRRVRRRILGW